MILGLIMTSYNLKFKPIELENATGKAKELLEDAKKRLGFVPNLYKNLANTPELLHSYFQLNERLNATTNFSDQEKDIILLTISKFNNCEYCKAVHTMTSVKMSGVAIDIVHAILNDLEIANQRIRVLHNFTIEMLTTKGTPSLESINEFKTLGYNDEHIFDIILMISMKTISNYANHIFNTEIDNQFKI